VREGVVSGEALAAEISRYAAAKKARELLEVDLRGLVSYTDYLLICTGNTERQTKAIHDGIEEGVRGAYGLRPRRVEGLPAAAWILMDYLDVVVHIFTPAMREFYRLEALWGEAPIRHAREPTPEPASQL
jgi:ribosome-associated protein